MVDNPSTRLAEDGPIFNSNVPGFEPGQLEILNNNLILTANKGIAFANNSSTTETNSQINTLGAGINANGLGNFSISTGMIEPYTDASNNSEQAGIWFGLDEDNFVKLVANRNAQLELRTEVNGVSENTDRVVANIPGLNTSNVRLRMYVDADNQEVRGFYAVNGGAEVDMGSIPLPASYIAGNSDYDNLSFAGVFASKRRENVEIEVQYTFTDFEIVPDNNPITFEPINVNFSRAIDPIPADYIQDSGLGYADRGNGLFYGWLTTDGNTPLDLSDRARFRANATVDLLQSTFVHMQYDVVDPLTGEEGIWEIEVPNGTYNVTVGVGDPNVDGQEGTEPFHTINVEGQTLIDRYEAIGGISAATRFTSATGTFTVTDGRLTIDAFGGNNTKIGSIRISQGELGNVPFFANVTPANNSTGVSVTGFQINVELSTPTGYELDEETLDGNVRLFKVTPNGEELVPSNSNDTGGGDAVTLTPLSRLDTFTDYI
ncbi:unnamed protein product, partial [Ectocarpus sp. 12 AP-2014]